MKSAKRNEILLKLLKAHESACRNRYNNLRRDEILRASDGGREDAYAYVIFLLENPEIIERLESRIDNVVKIITRPD